MPVEYFQQTLYFATVPANCGGGKGALHASASCPVHRFVPPNCKNNVKRRRARLGLPGKPFKLCISGPLGAGCSLETLLQGFFSQTVQIWGILLLRST